VSSRTYGDLLKEVSDLLKRDTEAEILVCHAIRKYTGHLPTRMDFFSRMGTHASSQEIELTLALAKRVAAGELLQHVTGFQVFLDHEYRVSPDVLIPRPETEGLVRMAMEKLKSATPPALGLEIGVGSGILSIELLAHFPGLRMIASEISPAAAIMARLNAELILENPERLTLVQAKTQQEVLAPLLDGLASGKADFLISNPPYLAEVSEANADVAKQEPHAALFAPPGDPLFFYREIAAALPQAVRTGGWCFLEVPHERSQEIAKLFHSVSSHQEMILDLNGRDRCLAVTCLKG